MSSYTWSEYPAHGTPNFEIIARATLNGYATNGAALEVRLNGVEDGTFFSGLATPIIPSSALVTVEADKIADSSLPVGKLDVEGAVTEGSTLVYRGAAGKHVNEPIEGVVGGDTYQTKLTSTGDPNYLSYFFASTLDITNGVSDKIVNPAGLQAAIGNAMLPVGSVIFWQGGYYTDSNNGGFVNVLGNDIASVNARFNAQGMYACSGVELYVAGSLVYDGPGRYLPNITDDRFIVGGLAAGSHGGSNTMAHTHSVNIPGFRSGGTVLTVAQMPHHTHGYFKTLLGTTSIPDGSGYGQYANAKAGVSDATGSGGSHDHYVNPPATTSGGASITNNMPKYLKGIYLIRVI